MELLSAAPEYRLTPHKPGCGALKGPEFTCGCNREVLRHLPALPPAVALRAWGARRVADMLAAGMLQKRRGRLYLSRLFSLE